MKGFRKINGINWLQDKAKINVINAGMDPVQYISSGRLPLHWQMVKNILLNNNY